MSPWIALGIGLVAGVVGTLYGLSWLVASAAPSYPPEVAERFEAAREKARWN